MAAELPAAVGGVNHLPGVPVRPSWAVGIKRGRFGYLLPHPHLCFIQGAHSPSDPPPPPRDHTYPRCPPRRSPRWRGPAGCSKPHRCSPCGREEERGGREHGHRPPPGGFGDGGGLLLPVVNGTFEFRVIFLRRPCGDGEQTGSVGKTTMGGGGGVFPSLPQHLPKEAGKPPRPREPDGATETRLLGGGGHSHTTPPHPVPIAAGKSPAHPLGLFSPPCDSDAQKPKSDASKAAAVPVQTGEPQISNSPPQFLNKRPGRTRSRRKIISSCHFPPSAPRLSRRGSNYPLGERVSPQLFPKSFPGSRSLRPAPARQPGG